MQQLLDYVESLDEEIAVIVAGDERPADALVADAIPAVS
jgi:hypothetical protein